MLINLPRLVHRQILVCTLTITCLVDLQSFALGDEEEQKDISLLASDCKRTTTSYTFVGHGEANSKSLASQGALIDARKNAIVCLFGGTITFNAETTSSNSEANYSGKTEISVSSENIDWSGFQMIQANDNEVDGYWRSETVFQWPIVDIEKNRKHLDALQKQKEKNRALANQVEETKALATKKEELIKKQKRELDNLRKHELELAQMKSEKERILARLDRKKKERGEKNNEWLDMVRKLGCGVTIRDLKEFLGKPEKTQVRFEYLSGDYYVLYKPLIYYVYGDYAIVAPQHDRTASDYDIKYGDFRSEADRYQVTYVTRYRGGTGSWWICEKST